MKHPSTVKHASGRRQAAGARLVALAALGVATAWPTAARAIAVQLDPAFGSGGAVSYAVSSGSGADEAAALALDEDGRIVVAGYATNPRQEMVVLRLLHDGSLDPGFGAGGVVRVAVGVRARAQAVTLGPDGRIVVAG